MGEALGFAFVASGPMVRSSYRAYIMLTLAGKVQPVAVEDEPNKPCAPLTLVAAFNRCW